MIGGALRVSALLVGSAAVRREIQIADHTSRFTSFSNHPWQPNPPSQAVERLSRYDSSTSSVSNASAKGSPPRRLDRDVADSRNVDLLDIHLGEGGDDMNGIARFSLVALDCPDPQALAQFYAALTGFELDYDEGDWVQLRSGTGATLAFQHAPDHQPPVWPSVDRPQQAHLDFDVVDLDQGEAQVLAIGARKAEHQPGDSFRVFLDPAGHPFCLVQAPT